MPDYAVSDLILGISNIVETSYNSLVQTSANFLGMRTRGRGFPVPDQEKFDDTGTIGNQSSQPTTQRSGFIIPPTMEITDTLSTELPLIYGRRTLGGADTTTIVEASIAWQHVIPMLSPYTAAGRQLPSSSIAYALGGANFLYGGCCFDTFRIDAAGVADPTFTAGIVGSGLYKDIATITAPTLVIPKPVLQNYMLGADSSCVFTDPTGTMTLSTSPQRLLNFSFTYNNNHDTAKRRVGDPKLVANDFNRGWYVNRMLHGDPAVGAELTVALDANMREFYDAHNNSLITDFKWTAQGQYIGASVINRYSYQVWFPKAYFRATRGNDQNGDAVLNIGIFPVEDGTNYGNAKLVIVNGSATPVV
jgi:hypothetical protein